MKLAFLFPGQGAQSVGMGADLAANIESSRSLFDAAHSVLGYDLRSLCAGGPSDRLAQTEFTQPALYTVSAAAFVALSEKGITAAAVAGHSVGEYAALFAAGAFDFNDGLKLVKERGAAMSRAASQRPGAMAAVLGLSGDTVRDICLEAQTSGAGVVVPANFNGAGQVVISGEASGVSAASALAKDRGAKKVIPLAVSGGFHSPLMSEAAEEMRTCLDRTAVSDAKIPVVANVTADYETTASDIKNNLTMQVAGPVRWEESMLRLIADGFDMFIELGSGSVLSGLAKRIAKDVRVYSVSDTAGLFSAIEAVES